jgi:uncharacterized protein (DUF1697 family)
MSRYAAFLRGINVGGHRVSGDEFRTQLERVGFGEVATFRASGNLIFSAETGGRPEEIAERIERALAESLGYEVPTFVRSEAEVKAIAAHRPFELDLVEASAGKLQVLLLSVRPSAAAREQVLAHATNEDRLAFEGQELYWLPSGRLMESALDLAAIGSALGPATQRTKATIDQIAAKYFAD